MFCVVAALIPLTTDLDILPASLLQAAGNPSLLCILGSHLLIHLKEAAEEGFNEGTSYRPKSLSVIDFKQVAGPSELEGKRSNLVHLRLGCG